MNSKLVGQMLDAARPFLRITGVERQDWCRNVKKGSRRGPWRYRAVYEVLDEAVWSTTGEVLYLVSNADGALRMVGQSSRRLKDRWRISPMYDLDQRTQIGRALFHSTAWPAIERAFDQEAAPFTVHALFRGDLDQVLSARTSGGIEQGDVCVAPSSISQAEAVEAHILATMGRTALLWNRAGIGA